MDICTAILALDPTASVSVNAEDHNQITWHDGNPNKITVDQIKAKQAELKAQWDSKKYQRDRKPLYGSWEEQLDMMYHSMDDWKAHCKAVRDKHPKP